MKMFDDDTLIVCSFSGGRTSAFLARYLQESPHHKNNEKLFVFANTGKENEETLEFVHKCDQEWNLNVVWLEAKVIHEANKGTTFNEVSFETASRNGEPFEEMLKKYPLPTNIGSTCTRELKLRPIKKYIKELGFEKYKIAIGIRHDERHRQSNDPQIKDFYFYPLCDELPVDEKFIRSFWDNQSFDLKLKDYQGNCDLCFKKSNRKKMTILKEDPEIAKWWIEMENKHGNEKVPRFDLRNNLSIEELLEKSKGKFHPHKFPKQKENSVKLIHFQKEDDQ